MSARIPPVPVKVVFGQRRPRPGKFKQLVGCSDGDLGREHLRLGRDDLRVRDGFSGRIGYRCIDRKAGLLQQRLRSVQPYRQVAHRLDGVRVLPGVFQPAIDPRPALGAHEAHRLIECRLRDPRVDSDLNDLEDRAVSGRVVVSLVTRHQVRFGHLDIVDQHGAGQRRALTKRRPVVDHRQPRRIPLGDRIPCPALIIECNDRHQMRKQCTGRVELPSAHDHVVAGIGEFRLEVGRAFGPKFGERVSEAHATQDFAE